MQHAALEAFANTILNDPAKAPTLDQLKAAAGTEFALGHRDSWLDHIWRRDQRSMMSELEQWWVREVDAGGWNPLSAETSFGTADTNSAPAVPFDLADGTTIMFRGKVDRIDQTDNRVRVIDYKGVRPKDTITPDAPTANGRRYQLAVYGLFAQTLVTTNGQVTVTAEYDYLRSPDRANVGFEVTKDAIDVLRSDVTAVVNAIRAGVFPPRPARGATERFTDLMGEPDLDRLWERLSTSPDLSDYARFFVADEANA